MSSSMATEGSALNCPLYLSSESKLQAAGIYIALACNLFLDFVFRTQGAVCEETREALRSGIATIRYISSIERHESTNLFFLASFSLEEKYAIFSSRSLLLNFSGLRFTSITSSTFSFRRRATISSSACW